MEGTKFNRLRSYRERAIRKGQQVFTATFADDRKIYTVKSRCGDVVTLECGLVLKVDDITGKFVRRGWGGTEIESWT